MKNHLRTIASWIFIAVGLYALIAFLVFVASIEPRPALFTWRL